MKDRFGHQGLTGIISTRVEGQKMTIVDFILSCRVMGRKVEEAMLGVVINAALHEGIEQVEAIYLPTKKNKPCLDFFERSGMTSNGDKRIFSWSGPENYPIPEQMRILLHDILEVN